MYSIKQTDVFREWLMALRDQQAKVSIGRRIERFRQGNFGDSKPVGDGVSEMRVDVGQGYRVYFVMRGTELVVLLSGGDKSSQQADIKTAKAMAKEV